MVMQEGTAVPSPWHKRSAATDQLSISLLRIANKMAADARWGGEFLYYHRRSNGTFRSRAGTPSLFSLCRNRDSDTEG
jgi:hypothetical protein